MVDCYRASTSSQFNSITVWHSSFCDTHNITATITGSLLLLLSDHARPGQEYNNNSISAIQINHVLLPEIAVISLHHKSLSSEEEEASLLGCGPHSSPSLVAGCWCCAYTLPCIVTADAPIINNRRYDCGCATPKNVKEQISILRCCCCCTRWFRYFDCRQQQQQHQDTQRRKAATVQFVAGLWGDTQHLRLVDRDGLFSCQFTVTVSVLGAIK